MEDTPLKLPTGADLAETLRAKVPFGRFAGMRLVDLPFDYLCWFQQKGWPPGKLGSQMATVWELQHNDFDLFVELRKVVG